MFFLTSPTNAIATGLSDGINELRVSNNPNGADQPVQFSSLEFPESGSRKPNTLLCKPCSSFYIRESI